MKKKIIRYILLALILITILVGYSIFGSTISNKDNKFLFIKTGSNYKDVTNELQQKKITTGNFWFNLTSKMLSYKNVKPGRYKLSNGMSIFSLVRTLKSGNQDAVSLVITKIRTKEVLASKVGKLFECDSTSMMAFLNNNDSLQQFSTDSNTAISLAMPLSYSIFWNSTPKKIVQQFAAAYKVFWTKERLQKAAAKNLSPVEVITLASIIEEETNKKSDKPNIASAYLNRIEKNMPLGADPTIKFALKDFGLRRILSGHLKVESPYNTYLHSGLPPGPICTASVETIEAVLDAPKTDYIFFVANSNFDGTHIFTTNYQDHLKFARLYQTALTTFTNKKDSLNNLNK